MSLARSTQANGSEQEDDAALLLPRRALGDVRADGERLRLLDRLPRQRSDEVLRALEELPVAGGARGHRQRPCSRAAGAQQRTEQQLQLGQADSAAPEPADQRSWH